MNERDAFDAVLAALHAAAFDDAGWPAAGRGCFGQYFAGDERGAFRPARRRAGAAGVPDRLDLLPEQPRQRQVAARLGRRMGRQGPPVDRRGSSRWPTAVGRSGLKPRMPERAGVDVIRLITRVHARDPRSAFPVPRGRLRGVHRAPRDARRPPPRDPDHGPARAPVPRGTPAPPGASPRDRRAPRPRADVRRRDPRPRTLARHPDHRLRATPDGRGPRRSRRGAPPMRRPRRRPRRLGPPRAKIRQLSDLTVAAGSVAPRPAGRAGPPGPAPASQPVDRQRGGAARAALLQAAGLSGWPLVIDARAAWRTSFLA